MLRLLPIRFGIRTATHPRVSCQRTNGRVTGRGIAGNLRQHYPNWLLSGIVILVLIANIINLGADLGAMADASALVAAGPKVVYILLFAIICASMQVLLQDARSGLCFTGF